MRAKSGFAIMVQSKDWRQDWDRTDMHVTPTGTRQTNYNIFINKNINFWAIAI